MQVNSHLDEFSLRQNTKIDLLIVTRKTKWHIHWLSPMETQLSELEKECNITDKQNRVETIVN